MTKGPRLWLSKHPLVPAATSTDQNPLDMRTLLTSFLVVWMGLVQAQGSICDQVQAFFIPFVNNSTVQFSNGTTGTGAGTLFFWTFGDGTSSQDAQPFHDYPEGGVYEVCLTVVTILTGENGQPLTCQDVQCAAVTIAGPEPCSPNFVVAMDWIPQGDNEVTFVATSTFPNTNFIWYFGDGTEAYGSTTDHTYAQAGTYAVCVTGWYYNESAQDTCWIEDCASVVVSGTPCNGLDACFVTNDLGNGVYFFDNCSTQGGNAQYFWDFGDGSSSTVVNAEHLYELPGVYSVCLTVYEGNCVDSTCTVISIAGPCNSLAANFSWSLAGGQAEFDNVTVPVGLSTTWLWNFGDGSTSAENSPSHFYTTPGTYQACLTAISILEGGFTCTDTYCVTVVVQDGQPCDPDFAVELAWNAGPNNTVFLTGGSNQPETYFVWFLGDGDQAYGSSVTHTYAEAGTYTVCLAGYTIDPFTSDTCWTEDCAPITVGGGNPCDSLNACFITNALGATSFFFDNCTGGPSGTQYFWTFGDGATSSGTNVDHQYGEAGTYEVCLTAFWQQCADTTCTMVTVFGSTPCDPLSAGYEYFASGLALQFVSATAGASPQSTFTWSFGDGATGSGPNPMHDYALPGTYEVCLHVESIYAFPGQPVVVCEDEICSTVTVSAGAFCDPLDACFAPLPFENGAYLFENCSQLLPIAIPATYFWDFGDGSTSTDAAPAHSFGPGIYSVCLAVIHGDCVDSTCTTITVNSGGDCDPDFSAGFNYQVQNNVVIFFANFDTPTMGVIWAFPDGAQAYEPIHTHLFEPPGPFEVCLSSWYWNEQTLDTCWAYTCQVVDPFNTTTGLDELTANGLQVFPVPANDQITVTGLTSHATIHLIGPDGRLVIRDQASSGTHRMSVQDLAPGTYLLIVEQGGERWHRRVAVK